MRSGVSLLRSAGSPGDHERVHGVTPLRDRRAARASSFVVLACAAGLLATNPSSAVTAGAGAAAPGTAPVAGAAVLGPAAGSVLGTAAQSVRFNPVGLRGPLTSPLPVPGQVPVTTTALPGTAAARAVEFALAQRGLPYVWGGDGPQNGEEGFDCSGLTTAAYAYAGIRLPRTAHTQYYAGPHVPAGAELMPGDLVFYGVPERVHHVGLYLGDGRMVNAPRRGKPVQIAYVRYAGDDYLGATRPAAGLDATSEGLIATPDLPVAVPPLPSPAVPPAPEEFPAPAVPESELTRPAAETLAPGTTPPVLGPPAPGTPPVLGPPAPGSTTPGGTPGTTPSGTTPGTGPGTTTPGTGPGTTPGSTPPGGTTGTTPPGSTPPGSTPPASTTPPPATPTTPPRPTTPPPTTPPATTPPPTTPPPPSPAEPTGATPEAAPAVARPAAVVLPGGAVDLAPAERDADGLPAAPSSVSSGGLRWSPAEGARAARAVVSLHADAAVPGEGATVSLRAADGTATALTVRSLTTTDAATAAGLAGARGESTRLVLVRTGADGRVTVAIAE